MRIKYFFYFIGALAIISCSTRQMGELKPSMRVRNYETRPSGMVFIPTGSLIMGQNDEDVSWSMVAPHRTVSIPAFWMDETEITNDEYHQFVNWVIDSVKRQLLADNGHDEFLISNSSEQSGGFLSFGKKKNATEAPSDNATPVLDRTVPLNGRNADEYAEVLSSMEYQGDDKVVAGELDVRVIKYTYSWFDYAQAALNDKYFDPITKTYTGGKVVNPKGEIVPIKGRSSFIMRKEVKVYPDTLCWIKDFSYTYNEPYVKEYFSHAGYSQYPVIGVNWHQAHAFCYWRSQLYNSYSSVRVHLWRLPSEAEWEYAARGGAIGQKYPWGGPYACTKKGYFLANFKPMRGNYGCDGGAITLPVGSYEPNAFGLYDMAGNVAEWTNDNYEESSYSFTNDMNPYYSLLGTDVDGILFKRKVIRGGSWKDISFYLQNGVRTYEFQDSARCYIGFRTVRTLIEY